MKKLVLLSVVVVLLSSFSVGCTTSNGTSWCRTGSLFPTARNRETTVYTTPVSASQCDPCTPNQCQPCEPACNPCEPACNPCDNRVHASYVPGPAQ